MTIEHSQSIYNVICISFSLLSFISPSPLRNFLLFFFAFSSFVQFTFQFCILHKHQVINKQHLKRKLATNNTCSSVLRILMHILLFIMNSPLITIHSSNERQVVIERSDLLTVFDGLNHFGRVKSLILCRKYLESRKVSFSKLNEVLENVPLPTSSPFVSKGHRKFNKTI